MDAILACPTVPHQRWHPVRWTSSATTIGSVNEHPASIADRLAGAGRRCFVGRRIELALFDDALAAPLPPFALLWFHGPGGIGKSTLLAQLRDRATAAARRVVRVDAALVAPQPHAFIDAIGLDLPQPDDDPGVLFIDTCEQLAPLHAWLRDEFLPQLPASWLVVCAGRQPPDERWRHDAQWASLLRVHRLDHFDDRDSRALLDASGIAAEHHGAALTTARGHPLALSLFADVLRQSGAAIDLSAAGSSVVQTLVERFMHDVPDTRHRDALQLAAFVRHTTEPTLAEVLGNGDARALFDWLQGLGCMQATSRGLVMHELVRDVLVADALWRDRAAATALRRTACRHFYDCLAASRGREQLHHQAEVLYVLRHQPHKQRFFDWSALGAHRVEAAGADDEAIVTPMVQRHEGDAALPWLRHWWKRQPDGFRLFRNADGGCDGFLLMLRLAADTPAPDRADPAVAAAWAFVSGQRPLVPGDELVVLRHWMHAKQYQAVTAAINLTAMHVVTHLITHSAASWSVVYMADPEFWQPHFDGVNFARCPAADFQLGDRRFGAFVHDWRFEPAHAWTAGDYRPMPFAQSDALPAADDAFIETVRDALRDYTDVDALQSSPLTQWLAAAGNGERRGEALRRRLRDAVERLGAHPRDRKFRDALWHTYIEPMQKQEQVAAQLDVPFATYRYRLQQGIVRVARMLKTLA